MGKAWNYFGDVHASVFAWHSAFKSIVWSSNPCLLPLPSTKFSYLLVRISPSIRSSEIDASGVLCVCVSAVRCLERTNRAGRLLLSVYREKSVGMRETEVKCCLSWTETTKVLSTHWLLFFKGVLYGLACSSFFFISTLGHVWDGFYWRFDGLKQTLLQHEFSVVWELHVPCSGSWPICWSKRHGTTLVFYPSSIPQVHHGTGLL